MNNNIFFFFYNLAHKSVLFDKIAVFTAVYFPFAVIFLAGIFLLMHHEIFKAENTYQVFLQKKKEILLVFFSGCFAWIIAQVLKLLIHIPRPFEIFPQVHPLFPETGFSFPSGHATFFAALAVSLFYSHKKAGNTFIFFALIISLARIVAGVHFPIDILGGFVLGSMVAYFVKKI